MRGRIALLTSLALLVGLVTASVAPAADDQIGAFTATKTVTRTTDDVRGNTAEVDRRAVTVNVDHTKNLQGRERVQITWSGAKPSGGRATNPFGENGMQQEYPMVILQCRGREGDDLPTAQRLRPETCWTASRAQRSQAVDPSEALWRLDPQASERDRGVVSGVDEIPRGCPARGNDAVHLTPFVARSGEVYAACSADTMPPEAAVDASFPPAEQAAFTRTDGTGSASFEVRSSIENESLGCDQSTACSIVVIPIMGLSCQRGTGELNVLNTPCRATGQFAEGSSNFEGRGVDQAVSPLFWWSASNWDNRITVPISFGAAPNTCNLIDDRAPTRFYGSEMMSQATLQWAPAYCLRKDRFRFQHNVLPDQRSYDLMQTKEILGAFVSGAKSGDESIPTEYAPTAISGFAISYVADKPDNAGEQPQLRLNARLIAKMLTQSYTGSVLGEAHPGMAGNPRSLNLDPEFRALNPGLDDRARESAAVLMNLSEASDVVHAMTEYLATDPEAAAFLDGAKDPWGMTINPSYKDIELPVEEWPLLDTFIASPSDQCLLANNETPYLTRLAAPVTSFRKIAEAVLDAWPLAQTKCSGIGSPESPYVLGRGDRQGVGSRFVLGVTTIADAERFGLRTAELQSNTVPAGAATFADATGRTFVAPTQQSLTAAIRTARSVGRGKPFRLDMAKIRATQGAYPGTLIVYTAARTAGLDKSEAGLVSSFITIATTEGQVRGTGNGRLPDGYLPLVNQGVTKALWEAAQQVAADIAGQVGSTAPSSDGGALIGGDGNSVAPGGDGSTITDAAPGADTPTDEQADAAKPQQKMSDQLESLGQTESLSSVFARVVLPALLLLMVGSGLAGPVVRLAKARNARRRG